jgi:hypothetical protein
MCLPQQTVVRQIGILANNSTTSRDNPPEEEDIRQTLLLGVSLDFPKYYIEKRVFVVVLFFPGFFQKISGNRHFESRPANLRTVASSE